MIHECHLPKPLKSPELLTIYCHNSFPANRPIPPCCLIDVGTLLFVLCAVAVQYLSWLVLNHDASPLDCGSFLQSMPILEKLLPCTSRVSIKRCMLEISQSLASLEDALLRLPPRRRKTPSGLTWGTSPRQGTYHMLLSSLALACSFCSILLSDSECSLLSSVSLLSILSFRLVSLSGLYPIPLRMSLYFNYVLCFTPCSKASCPPCPMRGGPSSSCHSPPKAGPPLLELGICPLSWWSCALSAWMVAHARPA